MITTMADIAVYDRAQNLQLVIEVKMRRGASPEWAAQIRQSLLKHNVIPTAPFFLLALPDKLYLWLNHHGADPAALPDCELDAREVLSPYIQTGPYSLDELRSELSFAMLVSTWLQFLVSFEGQYPKSPQVLPNSLFEAIKGGSVILADDV